MKKCIECNKELVGRIDKIFCNPTCKSSFHYKRNVQKEKGLYLDIINQLKFNRRVLTHFVKAGHQFVAKNTMVSIGFNPTYFTHQAKGSTGDLFSFCFEYGFFEKEENGSSKFILEAFVQA